MNDFSSSEIHNSSDLISRKTAIELIEDRFMKLTPSHFGTGTFRDGLADGYARVISDLKLLPPAQSEPAIPLSWIEGQIEWLKSLDNAFSTLTAEQISAMVNKWKESDNQLTVCPMCPDCPDNCPLDEKMKGVDYE